LLTGNLHQAEKEFQRLIESQPDSPVGYMGMIEVASRQKNWGLALRLWDNCLSRFGDLAKPQGLFAKARVLLELERTEEAEALCRDMIAAFPDYFGGYYGLALAAEYAGDWEAVRQHLDSCLSRFPGPMEVEWQAHKVRLLVSMDRFNEAEQLAQELVRKYPGCPEGHVESAILAERRFDLPLTYERWEKAYRLFPDHKGCAHGYIRCLNDQGEFEAAQTLCRQLFERTGDIGFQLSLVESYRDQLDNDTALKTVDSLIENYPDTLELKLKKIDVLAGFWQPQQAGQAVTFAEELYVRYPSSLKVRLKLIRSYIHAGESAPARQHLKAVPEGAEESTEVKRLRSWQCAQNGDIHKARELYQAVAGDTYVPALQAPFNLKRMDRKRIDPAAGELFLFCLVKDNVRSMPWFLDYYRKLGVRRFFMVDNDSTDGTGGYLLEQPDVHLFWSDDSFYTTGSGLRWINHLVGEYGEGHWCILADSDEALVVPGVETGGLSPVLRHMESNGHEALSVFLLDMYPETVGEFSSFPSSGDLLEHSPCFDNALRYFGNPLCPYRFVKGGVRERLFAGNEVLEKVSIIKGGGDIRFLNPHATTPAVVSDVTGVYLHFCLVQKPQLTDTGGQITNDSRVGDRSGASRKRYSRYHRVLSRLAKDESILCPHTERYTGSDQLLKLGLIGKPDGFRHN
jgi:predicted Zn-dependent protease